MTPCTGKGATRTRVIEDIPEDIQSEVVAHTNQRGYCPTCKKVVESRVPDALPGAQLGHRVLVLAEASHRIAAILRPWHEQIGQTVRSAGVLNADETGWRVLGKTHWLWCFCSTTATFYMIDPSRGSPALSKFFTEAIDGILISDFWAAYNAVVCGGRQACLPHLFRDLDATSEKDRSQAWRAFRKKLKRLLRDGLRLARATELVPQARASRRERLPRRLTALLNGVDTSRTSPENRHVKRIVKRLRRHKDHLFTFLDHEGVPSDNNRAEREVRPAVILRKNTHGNQSDKGAETQSILMSVFRTLRRRGRDPLVEIVKALRHYVLVGRLPPLPGPLTDRT